MLCAKHFFQNVNCPKGIAYSAILSTCCSGGERWSAAELEQMLLLAKQFEIPGTYNQCKWITTRRWTCTSNI